MLAGSVNREPQHETSLVASLESLCFSTGRTSKRNVPVLLRRQCLALVAQHAQRAGHVAARVRGRDHRVDVAALGRDVGVEQRVLVLLVQLGAQRVHVLAAVRGRRERLAVHDVRRAGGAHHRDLGARPGQVDVRAEMLGAHHVVGAAVGLAGDHRDQRDRGLRVGVDQLGTAPDDPVPLLVGAGQEAGHVHEGQHRHVERVAGAHEPRRLLRRVDVQTAGELGRLVGHHPDAVPVHPAVPDHDVRRVHRLHLEELALVEHPGDDLVDVVGLVRRVRDQRVQLGVRLGDRVRDRTALRQLTREHRRIGEVVGGQEGQQLLDPGDRVLLVRAHVVRVARLGVVRARAAEVLERDLLAGHRLHHVRAGDEHLRGLVDHHHEVGQRGRVHVAARVRPHNQRDLRDHPGGVRVAPEDLAVEAQRHDAFLDPRAAALVDADDRPAGLDRQVHHLDDLLAVHLAERPAEHRHVLAEHRDRPAVDGAVPGHHAVAVGPVVLLPEVRRPVPRVLVQLDERTGIEQQVDPLARGHLPLGMLLVHRARRTGVHRLVIAPVEVSEFAGGGVDVRLLAAGRLANGHGRAAHGQAA